MSHQETPPNEELMHFLSWLCTSSVSSSSSVTTSPASSCPSSSSSPFSLSSSTVTCFQQLPPLSQSGSSENSPVSDATLGQLTRKKQHVPTPSSECPTWSSSVWFSSSSDQSKPSRYLTLEPFPRYDQATSRLPYRRPIFSEDGFSTPSAVSSLSSSSSLPSTPTSHPSQVEGSGSNGDEFLVPHSVIYHTENTMLRRYFEGRDADKVDEHFSRVFGSHVMMDQCPSEPFSPKPTSAASLKPPDSPASSKRKYPDPWPDRSGRKSCRGDISPMADGSTHPKGQGQTDSPSYHHSTPAGEVFTFPVTPRTSENSSPYPPFPVTFFNPNTATVPLTGSATVTSPATQVTETVWDINVPKSPSSDLSGGSEVSQVEGSGCESGSDYGMYRIPAVAAHASPGFSDATYCGYGTQMF